MKSFLILSLLVLPLSGMEEPDKAPGVKKDQKPLQKLRLAELEYPIRNIGKADPRFAALQKEVAQKGPKLTLDELYSKLLAGETFHLERAQPAAVCKECNGFGRVADKGTGYRKGDGRIPCPICRGEGKVIPIQPLLLKW